MYKKVSENMEKENSFLDSEVEKYLNCKTSYLLTEIMRIFVSTYDVSIKLECLKLLNDMVI